MTSTRHVVHELVSELDYPMFIVTVAARGERAGCLVGFTTQCSIKSASLPRLPLGQEPDLSRRPTRLADGGSHGAGRAGGIATLFGEQTGDDIDKFQHCAWRPGPEGTPILEACANWVAGQSSKRFPPATTAFFLDPFDGASDTREQQFAFHRAKRMDPGHEA